MDVNKVRLHKICSRGGAKNQETTELINEKDKIDAIWKMFSPKKDILFWETKDCSCGEKSGLVERDGIFYAVCSKCDEKIVKGEDKEEVVRRWDQEMLKIEFQ